MPAMADLTRAPTIRQLRTARRVFERQERRALFYRVATELLTVIRSGKTSLTVAEALAVLLQTWNSAVYQYHPDEGRHLKELARLLSLHAEALEAFRDRTLESLGKGDAAAITRLFKDFDIAVGPVGAVKCLHLLAPRFFPLWDRAIAREYRVSIKRRGQNGEVYLRFMNLCKTQVQRLGGERRLGKDALKALDEYNYCKFTKGWV